MEGRLTLFALLIVLGGSSEATAGQAFVNTGSSQPKTQGQPGKCSGSTTNLALNRPATQSSTDFRGAPGRAVDGNRNAIYAKKSCSHTGMERDPWWRVDLGSSQCVDRVVVVKRQRIGGHWLDGFQVYVGDNPNVVENPTCGKKQSVAGKDVITVDCGGLTGRYVGIALPGKKQYLILCEVEVYGGTSPTEVSRPMLKYGQCAEGTTNLALNRPATQSSTDFKGAPGRAVDGNRNAIYAKKSCSHTAMERDPWWRVDLGSSQCIDRVVVVKRQRIGGHWLDGFQVYVGDNPNVVENPTCGGKQSVAGKDVITVDCGGLTGRYVGIALPGKKQYLILCEVEVYGGVTMKTQKAGLIGSVKAQDAGLTSSSLKLQAPKPKGVTIITQKAGLIGSVKAQDAGLTSSGLKLQAPKPKGTSPTKVSRPIPKYDQCAEGITNLALNRPATQSSTDFKGAPGRAVDGNRNAIYAKKSCSHTGMERDPWWRVDLGSSQCIDRVVVVKRQRIGGHWLEGFQVYVGDNPNVVENPTCGGKQSVAGKDVITVDCGGLTGRYVGIALPGKKQYLILCEVEVYGGVTLKTQKAGQIGSVKAQDAGLTSSSLKLQAPKPKASVPPPAPQAPKPKVVQTTSQKKPGAAGHGVVITIGRGSSGGSSGSAGNGAINIINNQISVYSSGGGCHCKTAKCACPGNKGTDPSTSKPAGLTEILLGSVERNEDSPSNVQELDTVETVSEPFVSEVSEERVVLQPETRETQGDLEDQLADGMTVSDDDMAVSDDDMAVSDDYTAVSDDYTAVSDDDTTVSDDYTAVSDDYTAVSDDYTAVSDDDTTVSDDDTAVSDDYTAVSDDDTTVSDDGTAVSDDGTAVSDDDTAVSDDYTAVSDDDTTVSDDGTAVSDDYTAVSDDGTAVSDDYPAVSDDDMAVSNDDMAVSNDDMAVSDDYTAVSDDYTAVSDDGTAVSDDDTAVSDDYTAVSDDDTAVSDDGSAAQAREKLEAVGSKLNTLRELLNLA
ncbi:PREDICTED: uncharacterized protein LOC109474706 isoform X3 [Branchiostoma belcheri]|uniref:Uncharacterized protein LOC109474706 isoform X3 n=1 Tax=Branchiostoma belcheri TaxID=7741 RepID=A0A6P4YMA3_BRABE|nr:PREDICTED: uncharacterized protein LOC109474706 isoform X3 [Branchiostoma belcheri]